MNDCTKRIDAHYYDSLFAILSIGIPYAIRNAGVVAGVLLLVLVSYMTDKSLRILIELANFHPKLKDLGVHTFEDLMSIPFGRFGTLFVLVNMYVLLLRVMSVHAKCWHRRVFTDRCAYGSLYLLQIGMFLDNR